MARKRPVTSKRRVTPGNKFRRVMHEFKHHQLHSGSKRGPLVTSIQQAKAIGFSEQRRARRR